MMKQDRKEWGGKKRAPFLHKRLFLVENILNEEKKYFFSMGHLRRASKTVKIYF